MATVQNFIQADASIVTVTNLKVGDVYKRLVKDYSDNYEVLMGIVTSILNNGEDTAITALEFSSDYSGTDAKIKTFGTSTDMKIFDATPDEIATHLSALLEKSEKQIETKMGELAKHRSVAQSIRNTMERATSGQLSAPATLTGAVH